MAKQLSLHYSGSKLYINEVRKLHHYIILIYNNLNCICKPISIGVKV